MPRNSLTSICLSVLTRSSFPPLTPSFTYFRFSFCLTNDFRQTLCLKTNALTLVLAFTNHTFRNRFIKGTTPQFSETPTQTRFPILICPTGPTTTLLLAAATLPFALVSGSHLNQLPRALSQSIFSIPNFKNLLFQRPVVTKTRTAI